MNFKFTYYWLLLLVPPAFISWYFITKNSHQPLRSLTYFGPKKALMVNDTTYHFIPPFEFTDQYRQKVTENTVKNKIYVTEYFFTTCQSICPVMNRNLDLVYFTFKNDPDVMILSHTVDPETDSVPILKAYAAEHHVNDKKWLFVTGDKPMLYDLARKGYLLNAEDGNGGAEDFIHTQNFALVDKERHIRGYYDGTDSLEIQRMIREIKILQEEYAYKDLHP